MKIPGKGPVAARRLVVVGVAVAALAGAGTLTGIGLSLSAGPAGASPTTTTTTTNPWVPGINGTMTVGIDQPPTGCNPNTASGDTWATRLVLEPVLPSAFVVNGNDQSVYDSALITQAELQSTNPETIVYTINPKAVWSDGKPVTAADFIYTWQQERGTTGSVGSAKSTPPSAGTGPTAAGSAAGSTAGGPTPGGSTSTSTTAPAASTPASAKPTGTPAAPTPSGAASGTATTSGAATTLPGATGTTGPAVGYRQIKSMKAGDHGRTVTVVFKTPYEDWQSLFDDLLPAQVLQKTGWSPSCTTVDPSVDLSAGPFEIAKVVPGQEVVLARNPRWWQSQPALARIVVRIAKSPTQLAQWLANGTVDVALPTGFDQHYLERVTALPSVSTQLSVSTTFLELEMSTTSTVTSSATVRQAIAHAVDRQALVDQTVGWADSGIVPSESFLSAQSQGGYTPHRPPPLQVTSEPGYTPPPGSSTSNASTFPVTADLAATGKLLTSLGFTKDATGHWVQPDGKPFSLRMAVDAGDSWAASVAPQIVRQLGAAGITVTQTTAKDAQAAGEALSTGAADMALLPLHSSPYPSQALGWYSPLLGAPGSGGSQDWSNLNDPTVNSLLAKGSQELNPVDATPVYAKANTQLWQDMPGLPLFAEPSLTAWSGITDGVFANANGPSLLWTAQNWAMRVPPTSKDTEAS